MEGLVCISTLLQLIGIVFACAAIMFSIFCSEDFADCFMRICAFFFSAGAVFFCGFVIAVIYNAIY